MSLLTRIRQMGGIDPSYALDLTGERAGGAKGVPVGLFARGSWKGGHGTGLDDLATRLRDDGYDIPHDGADGGVAALARMIQDELRGVKHYNFYEQDRMYEAERDALTYGQITTPEDYELPELNIPVFLSPEATE